MSKTEYLSRDILNLPMQENAANANTIGDYLKELLLTLWLEGEGFSAKRPFGNSDWEYELYHALVLNNAITGKIVDGTLDYVNTKEGNRLITKAIQSIYLHN